MSAPYRINPDKEFLSGVLTEGGEDLKKCFQCATCSVVCGLSNGQKPFPRKEMIWAQWGLKDRIVTDPDIWLCHQCNDCSVRCPRGARPGDVLAALRRETVLHYSMPPLLGRCANRVQYLPLMLLVATGLLALALMLRGPLERIEPLAAVLGLLDHHGFYADLFPHWLLIGFFSFFTGLAFLGAAVGLVRFWRAMKAADVAAGGYAAARGMLSSVARTLAPIISHNKFGKCESRSSRRIAHLGAFYGFAALFLVSAWAVLALYVINPLIENDLAYPFGLLNPWKILANVGAIVLIGGCALAIRDRIGNKEEAGASTAFDWLFVWLLLGVGVSGLLTEILRFAAEPVDVRGLQYTAYAVYFVHLVLVFQLLVYLPYSKFAHVLYRTVALVYAEHTGRNNVATGGGMPPVDHH
jgi:quinone-modifying oxidoreductase subunit QmoC